MNKQMKHKGSGPELTVVFLIYKSDVGNKWIVCVFL
jgi:hypothetical protein